MKKLLIAFVAVVAVSFASCGGNTEATVNDSDSVCDSAVVEEPVAEDTTVADTTVADTVVAE